LNWVVQPSMNEVGVMEAIELYFFLGRPEKARALAIPFLDENFKAIEYFMGTFKGSLLSPTDAESAISTYVHVKDILDVNQEKELAATYTQQLEDLFKKYQ